MATADSSTAPRASDSTSRDFSSIHADPARVVKLFDQVSYLAESYDSLQLLAISHHGDSDPVAMVLAELNKRFETLLDLASAKGLLS